MSWTGGAAPRLLLALALLAATLVLWAGAAGAQTATISPTGSVNVTEGDSATAFSVTVANMPQDSTARFGLIEIKKSGGVTSGDFNLYDSDPSMGSPTALSITDAPNAVLPNLYYIQWNAVADIPSTETTYNYWIEVPDDSVLFEGEESIEIAFVVLAPDPYPQLTASETLTLNVTDAPLPAPTAKPTAPANLTATAGRGAVTLAWGAIDDTSSNTNVVNDVQITKHQVRQSTDGGTNYTTWTDIPNSAYGEVNAASYTIGSLNDGTEYTFQVRAVNGCTATSGCGDSDPATAVMAMPDAEALAAPTGLMAAAGNRQITLNWTDPDNTSIWYYEYQQKEGRAAFGEWTEIPDSAAATTSYRLTGLNNGTAYSYRIRARTTVQTSLASDAVTATPQGALPAAPALTATPRHGGVTLSWPNPVDASLSHYEYQYRIGAGAYQPWRTARERTEEDCGRSSFGVCAPPYLDTSGPTLQFAVGGLTNGSTHTFRIRAVNADGQTISNEASAVPAAAVPAKPTGLTTWWQEVSDRRVLAWDPVADPSILRYEYTTDEGRTWSTTWGVSRQGIGYERRLPNDEFLSGYTFRIRAVNAEGPGPASERAVEEDAEVEFVNFSYTTSASVEWDPATRKATLVWDQTEHTTLRWWNIHFSTRTHGRTNNEAWTTNIPIGTTRYEIPSTFDAGDDIVVWIVGCLGKNCFSGLIGNVRHEDLRNRHRIDLVVDAPQTAPTGFSATGGDARITLAWDDPMDSSITKYQYAFGDFFRPGTPVDIPDGDDSDSNPGNETSYTVTMSGGSNLENGSSYIVRLRAVNANGAGPWTLPQTVQLQASGTPAPPSGVVTLRDGPSGGGVLTTWDDPQDPTITGYQYQFPRYGSWTDIPGSDATTTGVEHAVAQLRAVNARGAGLPAASTTVDSPAAAQPTGLRAAPANRRVTLTWDDPGKGVYIGGYRYTPDGGETWTDIPGSQTTLQGQFTRYTVPNLVNGQTYTFAIQAENSHGASPLSATVTATPRAAAPARPTGLSAAPGDAAATLAWDDPHDPSITKYQVKQDSAAWADISASGAATTSHTVSGLANGTSYTFRIRAVNDHNGDNTDDPGAASDAVTVTPGVPTAPATFSVTPGAAQATLAWTAPASGSAVTGYEYTSNADAATPVWTDVPDSGSDGRADETGYTVTSLDNNAAYAFAVRAENANGPGAATPTLRAVPVHPDAPQRPAGFRATPGNHRAWLTWSPPSNPNHPVTSYQYRQSTDGGATWRPDWTAITDSDADTTGHLLTFLANGATHTFELRALKDGAAGPAARAQATPSRAAAKDVITSSDSGELTARLGGTYTVTQLSPPEDLAWRVTVPGTTDIDGRTFTFRSLQGTTPLTSPRYRFTSTGQEGLDIEVDPPLTGPAQVCVEPTPELRREAGGRPLLLLRYNGAAWTPLSTTYEGGMVCGSTASFSAFVVGYAVSTGGGGGGGGGGAAPDLQPDFGTAAVPDQDWTENARIAPLTLPEATGGDAPLAYSLTPNPPWGVLLDAEARLMTGRPAGAQEATEYTWTVRDADGDEDSLTFSIAVAADPRREMVRQALRRTLAGLARRAMSSALDNIGARFDDIGGSSLTLAGRAAPLYGSGASPDGGGAYMAGADAVCPAGRSELRFGVPSGCAAGAHDRGMEIGELMRTSAFSLLLGASEGADGGAPGAPLWSVWGRGDIGTFAGRGDYDTRYDGDLRTGWLGMDARSGPWVAGLAFSHGEGDADYGFTAGGLSAEGRLRTSLTAVYPYGRWTFGDGLELRGVVGAGEGEMRHRYSAGGEETRETGDLSMRMASAGARQALAEIGGVALAARADASVTRIEGEAAPEDAIDGLSADSWRLRAGMEASRRFALGGEAALEPFVEAALRRDGGDGLSGTGAELAGGLRYSASNIWVEARGRWLAAHSEAGAEEKGASLTARVGPGAEGRGLFFSLAPSWGAGVGAGALWNEDMPQAAGAQNDGALEARLGYGLGMPRLGGMATPFAELGLADADSRRLRLGTRFAAAGAPLEAELAGERRESAAGPPDHALRFNLHTRF